MTRMHCAFLAPELSATSSMLLVWIMARSPRSSRGPAQDLTDAPPLLLRHRSRLLDEDAVTDLGRIRLVVGLEPLRSGDDPLVARVAIDTLDHHHACLRHLVAHHHALFRLDLRHEAPLLLARALELTLALHGLGAREVPLGLLHPRGILRHAHGKLEPQIEQLLGQLLDLLLQVLAAHLPPALRFHGVLGESDRRSSPRSPPLARPRT